MSGPSTPTSSYDYSGSGIDMSFISYFYALASNGPALVENTLRQIAKEEEKELKRKARNSPVWHSDSENISVTFSGDSIDFEMKGAQQALEKEYGDLSTAPSPLFRSAAIRAAKSIPLRFQRKIEGAI